MGTILDANTSQSGWQTGIGLIALKDLLGIREKDKPNNQYFCFYWKHRCGHAKYKVYVLLIKAFDYAGSL
jgi:hypothetical protein